MYDRSERLKELFRELITELLRQVKDPGLTGFLTVTGLDLSAADAALAAVGRRLGIILAPVASALNLFEVVLVGPPDLLDGPLRDAALRTIQERTMPVIGSELRLRMTALGEDGALSGAAVLVLSGQLGVS